MKNKLPIVEKVIDELRYDGFYSMTMRPNEIIFQGKYEPLVVMNAKEENLWSKWTISDRTGYIESRKSFFMEEQAFSVEVVIVLT
jgi:hypothetical protein